jgi:site-specific recombinase XerD
MKALHQTNSFPALLQQFFLERLIQQRNASAQTVASYRDSFCLLLRFAESHLGKAPERFTLTDLDAPLILAFLNSLENERYNKIRSRNARFAAIRSFMHFAALMEPAALPVIQRVLAIPMKRFDKPLLGFLSRDEIQAILDAPDVTTWCGHRDRAMFSDIPPSGC